MLKPGTQLMMIRPILKEKEIRPRSQLVPNPSNLVKL
ncbi:UNVERIFIED_CONTAM: hypothetical protein GTU68_045279 [Idotea baltica]|nr:hypothetical protein [Idotea baltica]